MARLPVVGDCGCIGAAADEEVAKLRVKRALADFLKRKRGEQRDVEVFARRRDGRVVKRS